MKRFLIIAVVFLSSVGTLSAQKLAVKTNALYWGTATLNVASEYAVADRWTVELSGAYNPWVFNKDENTKAKHYQISPEGRYWFCEAFQGHFVGLNMNFTQYNVGNFPIPKVFIPLSSSSDTKTDTRNSRMEGWAMGTGVTYGYAFPFARRWNLELTLGLGWWYTKYDQFESRKCGLFQQTVSRHVLGPTALGVSFIYMIK